MMKRMMFQSAILLSLMASIAACTKQDMANVTAENAGISDEISDGNSSQFGNAIDSNLSGDIDAGNLH